MLIVKKYGGSSVSTPEKIKSIASHLKKLRQQGQSLIVVVSAMGDTTDELVELSQKISKAPVQREMDMLLSAGERISMALMSIALNEIGCPAISFTGSQSGILTDSRHSNARIIDVKSPRVSMELESGKVVVIAGFQGVNPDTKEITTLGRGGSDTTAVALAAAFKADRCDILTDVKGLYSIDPRIAEKSPKFLPKVDYLGTLEMAFWGARVIHYRAIEIAKQERVPLMVHLSSEDGEGTLINSTEDTIFRAVNYCAPVAKVTFDSSVKISDGITKAFAHIESAGVPTPQLLLENQSDTGPEFYILAPQEHYESISRALKGLATVAPSYSTVTITGRGFVQSNMLKEVCALLSAHHIEIKASSISPLSVTVVVEKNMVQKTANLIHNTFVT